MSAHLLVVRLHVKINKTSRIVQIHSLKTFVKGLWKQTPVRMTPCSEKTVQKWTSSSLPPHLIWRVLRTPVLLMFPLQAILIVVALQHKQTMLKNDTC